MVYSLLARLDATPSQEKAILSAVDELKDTARELRGTVRETRTHVARTMKGRALKRRVRSSMIDWKRTIAYSSAAGGGISLNLQGREAHGIVSEADYERVREEIRQAIIDFRDPATDDSPVARVFLKEELYSGPYVDRAPDLGHARLCEGTPDCLAQSGAVQVRRDGPSCRSSAAQCPSP